MKLVRRGICRDVLLVGPWAVKVPTVRYGLWSLARGLLANQSEARWRHCLEVAPMLWTFHGIVSVYRRCAPVLDGEADPAIHPAPYGASMDRKIDNLGRLPDGRIVWVDYEMAP